MLPPSLGPRAAPEGSQCAARAARVSEAPWRQSLSTQSTGQVGPLPRRRGGAGGGGEATAGLWRETVCRAGGRMGRSHVVSRASTQRPARPCASCVLSDADLQGPRRAHQGPRAFPCSHCPPNPSPVTAPPDVQFIGSSLTFSWLSGPRTLLVLQEGFAGLTPELPPLRPQTSRRERPLCLPPAPSYRAPLPHPIGSPRAERPLGSGQVDSRSAQCLQLQTPGSSLRGLLHSRPGWPPLWGQHAGQEPGQRRGTGNFCQVEQLEHIPLTPGAQGREKA